jgi:acrylyl-CoA reductase (NADPH)
MFKAILLSKDNDQFSARVADIDEAQLPAEGDVLVRVEYSTINYKDGLAIGNKSPVVRKWPMVPGIDCAGTVESSSHPDYRPGDAVILNGWGVGEAHWGGLAQKAKLKGDWLIRRPAGISAKHAMAIGTAGYTAMLCVLALEKHGIKPADGEILVTGASGGVGSVAIALLAKLGYTVVASTGKLAEADYLKSLGAAEVFDRAALGAPGKPLQKERFAGVVDTLGSHVLANACAQMKRNGAVAACGLAMGMDFPASVAPFILRGVTLYGIDSVYARQDRRKSAWALLAARITPADLAGIARVIGLSETVPAAERILAGRMTGRYVVDVNR